MTPQFAEAVIRDAALMMAKAEGFIPIEDAPQNIQEARKYIRADLVHVAFDGGIANVASRKDYEDRIRSMLFYLREANEIQEAAMMD